MTALNPLKGEGVKVRGVASETYPVNKTCAHPECAESVTLKKNGEPTVHHIFPRGLTKSASYFVEITSVHPDEAITVDVVKPHAVGLCGSGTTGHHGDVEEHRAWIKLEDGVYVWYDREGDEWVKIGPLNPQPGSTDGKTKRKRFKGEKRKKRKTISLRVPDDAEENGAELFDEAVEVLEAKIQGDEAARPIYYTLMSALDYAILNADATDFE